MARKASARDSVAQLGDASWALQSAARGRRDPPAAARQGAAAGRALRARSGTSPALASAAAAITEPDEIAIIDEIGELSFGATHAALQRARPGTAARAGSGSETASRSCAGTTATSSRRRWPAPSSARSPSTSTRPSRSPARRGDGAREHHRPDLRRGVRRPAWTTAADVRRFVAWSDGGARDPTARGADRGPRRRAGSARPAGERPLHHPHLGHDGHAQGRPARLARGAYAARRLPLQDPAARGRDRGHLRAPLPLLGLQPLRARPAARGDDGAAAALRPRGCAAPRSPSTGPGPWSWCR